MTPTSAGACSRNLLTILSLAWQFGVVPTLRLALDQLIEQVKGSRLAAVVHVVDVPRMPTDPARKQRTLLTRGVRGREHRARSPGGPGIIEANEQVTILPVPCDRYPASGHPLPECHRTVAYRPGTLTEVLTEHYRRAHPETLDLASR